MMDNIEADREQVVEQALDGVTEICVTTAEDHVFSDNTLDQFLTTDVQIRKADAGDERIAATASLLSDLQLKAVLAGRFLDLSTEQLNEIERDFINQRQQVVPSVEQDKKQISSMIAVMRNDSDVWLNECLDRVRSELAFIQGTAKTSELRKYFQFYLMDTTKSAIAACLMAHQEELKSQTVNLSKTLQRSTVLETVGKIDKTIAEQIPDISWTGFDSAMFIYSYIPAALRYLTYSTGFVGFWYALNISLTLMPIVQGITQAGRAIAIENKQAEFLAPIIRGFSTIQREVLVGKDAIYGEIEVNLHQQFDAYYDFQVDYTLDAVRQAKKLLVKSANQRQEFQERSIAIAGKVIELQKALPPVSS
jgi:hypothetical protein